MTDNHLAIHTIVDLPGTIRKPFFVDEQTVGGVMKSGKRAQSLVLIGLDGRVKRQFELADDFLFPIGVNDSKLWLACEARLEQLTVTGESVSDLDFKFESEEKRIGSTIFWNDHLIVALERLNPHAEHGLGGELILMQKDGEVKWGSVLPVDRIEFAGCAEASVETNFQVRPKPAWKPRTWVTDSRFPIFVSENHVYANWQEFPRSGIGKHYVVRVSNGHPVQVTKPLPVSYTCNLGDGRALISAGGYGACEITTLDPSTKNASGQRTWPTHGQCYKSPTAELFCVEMISGRKKSQHVVCLKPDATVEKIGEPLTGFYSSQPLGLSDGRFCFWRGNRVWVCDAKTRSLESIASTNLGDQAYAEAVQLRNDRIAILVYRNAQGSTPSSCRMIVIEREQ